MPTHNDETLQQRYEREHRDFERMSEKNTHGCCADKACNSNTCMELPEGKTCGHCVHERRCCLMFGHTPTDTYCDWFPRRFHERPATNAVVHHLPADDTEGGAA